MKRLLSYFLLLLPMMVLAQVPEYGKVNPEDFDVSPSNPEDDKANVLAIYHDASVQFKYGSSQELCIEVEYKFRYKILSEEGKEYANVTVPYYFCNGKSSVINGNVWGIKACAYNLENGKVVKSNMSGDYVFTEQLNDNYRVKKFTIPNVRVGTIIEYKYTVDDYHFWDLPTWSAQKKYPVKYAHYSADIPYYYVFNILSMGYPKIDFKSSEVNVFLSSDSKGVPGTKIEGVISDLPALKDEGFVENVDLYATRVEFELRQIQRPGMSPRKYSNTWEDVRKAIKKSGKFGKYLGIRPPFAEYLSSVDFSSMKALDKARTVYELLNQNVKWNGTYNFVSDYDPHEAVKKGVGTNADLNFLLLSMLKEVGVPSTPMMIKKRGKGAIAFPTYEDLSTFVISFTDENGGLFFLDPSAEYGGVNIVSPKLLGYGVLLDPAAVNGDTAVYNLFEIGGNVDVVEFRGIITESGELQGSRKTTHHGLNSLLFKMKYNDTDSVEFVKTLEENDGIDIVSYKTTGVDGLGTSCREITRFKKSGDVIDGRIYFNPLGLPDEHKERFISEHRYYPVEFPYLQSTRLVSHITIPEGYEVEELPKDTSIQVADSSVVASVSFSLQGNVIETKYKSEVNAAFVMPNDYVELRKFWANLLQMNNLAVVLRKK